MRKLLTYCSFVIACIVVIAAFINATNYIQLAVAISFYSMLAFFAYKILPIKQRYAEFTSQAVTFSPAKPEQETTDIKINNKTENIGISDFDKRVFLKLIGGAGIALFLFSIFNKKTEDIFFKSAGSKIDPVQKRPLDDYSISDIENNTITFYGFIGKDGSWYIMRLDTGTGAFRYTKDKSNFRANWTGRANLKYDYFDNVFKP